MPVFILLLASTLLSLLIFGTSIFHGFSSIDDSYLVVQNIFAHGLSIENIWYVFTHYDPELYIPLTFLSWQINYMMSGLSAWSYHLTNIVLHGINGGLIALLCYKASKNRLISILFGLLFLSHPINTEAVVWIAGRKDLLAGFFGLLSVYAFLYYQEYSKKRYIIYAAILFLCSLLSKPSLMTLPVVGILLYNATGSVSYEKMWKSVKCMSLFILLSGIAALIAWMGKTRVVANGTPLETVLMAIASTVVSIFHLLVPINLNPLYPYHGTIVEGWNVASLFLFSSVILLVIAVCCIAFFRRSRVPLILLCGFLILLSPTFLNFYKGEVMFLAVDRYAYLPFAFLLIVASPSLTHVMRHYRNSMIGTIGSIVLCFSILSMYQTTLWRDEVILFSQSVNREPNNLPARLSLAALYRERGETQKEEIVLRDGLALMDEHDKLRAHYFLGLASLDLRRGAFADVRQKIDEARMIYPELPEISFYEASLLEVMNQRSEAKEMYKKALLQDDSYVAAAINLGALYLEEKNNDEARKYFEYALRWNPSSVEALFNLSQLEIESGDSSRGMALLERAFALAPENSDIGIRLALQYDQRNEREKMMDVLQTVLRYNPTNATARRIMEKEQEEL